MTEDEWKRLLQADGERAWAECPRGDWLVAAAARAGMPGRELLGIAHTILGEVFGELSSRGIATEEALLDAIDVLDAWLDERLDREEVRARADEIIRIGSPLAVAVAVAAKRAANGEEADAGDVVRAPADRVGPKGHALGAALVRSHLAWEQLPR